jgi:hypothetical protein
MPIGDIIFVSSVNEEVVALVPFLFSSIGQRTGFVLLNPILQALDTAPTQYNQYAISKKTHQLGGI